MVKRLSSHTKDQFLFAFVFGLDLGNRLFDIMVRFLCKFLKYETVYKFMLSFNDEFAACFYMMHMTAFCIKSIDMYLLRCELQNSMNLYIYVAAFRKIYCIT